MRVIGIDPDLVASGVGIVENGQLIELQKLPFYELQAFIDRETTAGAVFVIEDVERNRPTFNRNVAPRARDKISQNVGQVKAISRLLAQHPAFNAANLMQVRPLGYATKHKPDLFKKLTGWTGTSNEDTRDAAMLALYGWRMMIRDRIRR